MLHQPLKDVVQRHFKSFQIINFLAIYTGLLRFVTIVPKLWFSLLTCCSVLMLWPVVNLHFLQVPNGALGRGRIYQRLIWIDYSTYKSCFQVYLSVRNERMHSHRLFIVN